MNLGERPGSDPARGSIDRLSGSLVLVGMPGTGKSTVAPVLAAALGRDAIDLDSLVERKAGCSVSELFDSVGEVGFRELEREALVASIAGPPIVLAAGGGVVTREEARSELRGCSVAWLRARPETLAERLSRVADGGAERPLLATDDPQVLSGRIEALLAEREALYEEVADVVVDVDDRTPEQVAQAILVLFTRDDP